MKLAKSEKEFFDLEINDSCATTKCKICGMEIFCHVECLVEFSQTELRKHLELHHPEKIKELWS